MRFGKAIRTIAILGIAVAANSSTWAAGQKYSLCIGIDQYPVKPLACCVNDARDWQAFFSRSGFTVQPMITNGAATHDGIKNAVLSILKKAQSGDIVAIQYSGHGTLLTDRVNPAERSGYDQAIVPVDLDVIVDDEFGGWIDQAAAGVNIYIFFDCCHSGSATRFFTPPARRSFDLKRRDRFLPATASMIANARQRQAQRSRSRDIALDPKMTEILFAACLDRQTSEEDGRNGVFTKAALSVFQGGFVGTNREFITRATAAMGPTDDPQTPLLSCSTANVDRPFLSSRPGSGSNPGQVPLPPNNSEPAPNQGDLSFDEFLTLLKAIGGEQPPKPRRLPGTSPQTLEEMIELLDDVMTDE